jgi:hypothetical protein
VEQQSQLAGQGKQQGSFGIFPQKTEITMQESPDAAEQV